MIGWQESVAKQPRLGLTGVNVTSSPIKSNVATVQFMR